MSDIELTELDVKTLKPDVDELQSVSDTITDTEQKISSYGHLDQEMKYELEQQEEKLTTTKDKYYADMTKLIPRDKLTNIKLNSENLDKPGSPEQNVMNGMLQKPVENIQTAVAEVQAANGEKGSTLQESPRTMRELAEKYGLKILMTLLVISALVVPGAVYAGIAKHAEAASGCYYINLTNGVEVVNLPCYKDDCETKCTCDNSSLQTDCSCNGKSCPACGGDDNIQYFCRHYSPSDIPFQIYDASDVITGNTGGNSWLDKVGDVFEKIFEFTLPIILIILVLIVIVVIVRHIFFGIKKKPN